MNNQACRTEGTLDSFFCFSEFFSMSSCVSLERSNHLQGDWDSIIYGGRGNHFRPCLDVVGFTSIHVY